MRMIIALICFTAFTGCVLDDSGMLSEESQATVIDGAAATPGAWLICQDPNLLGKCLGGPFRTPDLGWWFNDTISSIQTNETAMETWNGWDFKGTYGYFAPWGTWPSLSSPYNNAIKSVSYPGV